MTIVCNITENKHIRASVILSHFVLHTVLAWAYRAGWFSDNTLGSYSGVSDLSVGMGTGVGFLSWFSSFLYARSGWYFDCSTTVCLTSFLLHLSLSRYSQSTKSVVK